MANTDGILLGRRTYEDFLSFWPKQTDDNPYTAVLNATQQFVASTTLEEPLAWNNSTLLEGDAADAVAALKEGPARISWCWAAANWPGRSCVAISYRRSRSPPRARW